MYVQVCVYMLRASLCERMCNAVMDVYISRVWYLLLRASLCECMCSALIGCVYLLFKVGILGLYNV